MSETMKKAGEDQKRLLKIKADILTTLIQWDGVKTLSRIARDTNHTEEEIKTVIPDLMGPNGPIIFHGFHKDEPHFRMPQEWDIWGPAQKLKVRADLVDRLSRDGLAKTINELSTITGHSEETLRYHLPDLLYPSGPILCSITDGVARYRIKNEDDRPPEGRS